MKKKMIIWFIAAGLAASVSGCGAAGGTGASGAGASADAAGSQSTASGAAGTAATESGVGKTQDSAAASTAEGAAEAAAEASAEAGMTAEEASTMSEASTMDATEADTEPPAITAAADAVHVRIGYENSADEPLGMAIEGAKQTLLDKSNGEMTFDAYPDSELGDKFSLMDSMLIGENVVTLADGADLAEYGQKDMSILLAPYLFDDWDQVDTLVQSDWYKDQCTQLEKRGFHVITSNWHYGARELATNKPVHSASDLSGIKLRIPETDLQEACVKVYGATPVSMALADVSGAFDAGTIDGVENPLSVLYEEKLSVKAPYILLDNHVLNYTSWVCSADWYNSLTKEQQTWLTQTLTEAGEQNNTYVDDMQSAYQKKLEAEGAILYTPTKSQLEELKKKAEDIYTSTSLGWSTGLYDKVKTAMGAE